MSQRVSLTDVFPTILSVAGIEASIGYHLGGVNIHPGALEPAVERQRPMFAEVSKHANNRLDLIGVIGPDGHKLVLDASTPRGASAAPEFIGLRDTNGDFAASTDLRSSNPVRAAYCEQVLAEWLTTQRQLCSRIAPESLPRLELSDETERELRGLGYLD